MSGGRFIFGIGGGWNREEMENHGTRFGQRWKLLRERIEAMKVIWAKEESEYHGDLVDFDAIRSWPKPVQQPHPPIVLGGNAPRTLERVVRYGDGWMPNTGDVAARIPDLQRMADVAGRDPIPVSVFPEPSSSAIEQMIGAQADRSIFWLPDSDRDTVLHRLEEWPL